MVTMPPIWNDTETLKWRKIRNRVFKFVRWLSLKSTKNKRSHVDQFFLSKHELERLIKQSEGNTPIQAMIARTFLERIKVISGHFSG